MKILSFDRAVKMNSQYADKKFQVHFNPGTRYVIEDYGAKDVEENCPDGCIECMLDLDEFILTPPRNWSEKRVLFYIFACAGGYGDQLMAGCLPRYFKEVLGAKPYQVCHPLFEDLWNGNPYITGRPLLVPLALDGVWRWDAKNFFDWSMFIEKEEYTEPENTYDQLFRRAGIDPATVDDEFKRPVFHLTQANIDVRDEWLKQVGVGEYYVLQLSAGSNGPARSLPLDLVERLLEVVSGYAVKRKAAIICVSDTAFHPEVANLIRKTKNAMNLTRGLPTVRHYAAMMQGAKLVVGPDSSAIHFAAAFNKPALGLWGLFSPHFRTHYYLNQKHLFHSELVQISDDPKEQIRLSQKVLSAITEEELSDSIGELLGIYE